ncbi:hypothetical protein E2493_17280 [Sphingomonas parva]|uniref:Uncharacterized protein n=1 Tax=Sphingomonas parva TaxID=2555898 RepID=A0A4Y8ZLV8_9SPHN|nr:hypothetical protein [Sphingomonas parva]TFI56993.1 hypothetical protein E2493_17280 [Sphingomonas parva]
MIRVITIGCILAATASAAAAEDLSARETRKLVDKYARCIVAARPIKAAEALVANVDTQTMVRDYTRLIDPACLLHTRSSVVSARFPGDSYRYALADALVRRELAALPAPELANVAPLTYRPLPEPPRPLPEGAGWKAKKEQEEAQDRYLDAAAYDFAARYGECVVRADPVGTKAVLLSEPASAEETTRFAAIVGALQTCVAPGRTQAFTRIVLRGAMAVAYYRLAHAAGRVGGEAAD